jgi:hypothetical protein
MSAKTKSETHHFETSDSNCEIMVEDHGEDEDR